MDKPKICAVVLNYKAYNETIDCVNSILRQNYDNFEVVIVENGSNNASFEILNKTFSKNSLVHILFSEDNLGFAKGNNLGIVYARDVLNSDFVFVVNSDIIIPNNLFDMISHIDYNGIGVISPTVYRADGSYQMPNENTNNIYSRIKFLVLHLFLAKVNQIFGLRKKKRKLKVNRVITPPEKWNTYVLQGCAYFLTPDFFANYKRLYPKTFLYWEEINLLFYIHKANLKSILIDSNPVIHKDKGSTNLITDNLSKFQLKHSFRSMLKSLPLYSMSFQNIIKKFND